MKVSSIARWMVAFLSRALSPEERDFVLGDLEESGASPAESLRGVAGLVLRRQGAMWSESRPWLILGGLTFPLGVLLSVLSRGVAGRTAVYFWFYVDNWKWSFINTPGCWLLLAQSAWHVFFIFLTLASWSWTGGFVLGIVSRRNPRTYVVLLAAVLLLGTGLIAPYYQVWFMRTLTRVFPPFASGHPYHDSDAVFDVLFYRSIFPFLIQGVTVLLPTIWGMRHGARTINLPRLLTVAIWTAVLASLAVMLMEAPGLGLMVLLYGGRPASMRLAALARTLTPIAYWPLLYFVLAGIRRFRRPSAATA